MESGRQWVILTYRLPREPSTPRIALWRKLRRLGVAQLLDGVVALPADARTKEQLEWVADEVVEEGGEASLWLARPGSTSQELAMAKGMATAISEEYRAVATAAAGALMEDGPSRRRTLARLRRELHRIGLRDFFPPPEREQARAAVDRLAQTTEIRV